MVFFIFIKILIEIIDANSGDPDQTPLFAASDLGLYCLPMSHKKDARLIMVNTVQNHNVKIQIHDRECMVFCFCSLLFF